jgi:hypothetical protein
VEVIGVKHFQVGYTPIMDPDLMLRRTWTFRAQGKKIVTLRPSKRFGC